jgi:undecaprenyl diphosphate synthase
MVGKQFRSTPLPGHIAIIMDGNGRWAELHGDERIQGHRHGVDAVRSVVEGAGEAGIKYLTLYAFSTENWDRPREEINALMNLLVSAIIEETDNLCEKNVRMLAIGDLQSLPLEAQLQMKEAIEKTSSNTGLTLVLALSYSGRWEILEAVRRIVEDVRNNKILDNQINDVFFESYLSTAGIPDPELLIRTSGEYRVSNFLLWQIAYTEFYFTPKLWPDFRKEDLFEAIVDFQQRERRFGKTSEQIRI